jgi:hypothetical protein
MQVRCAANVRKWIGAYDADCGSTGKFVAKLAVWSMSA